jgi:hypothetical protein
MSIISNLWNKATGKTEVVKGVQPTEVINLQQNRIKQQVYRTEQEIGKWRSAVKFAESEIFPNRYQLYQIYQDVVLDPHLTAVRNNIKNKCLGVEYAIVDEDGVIDEEKTKFLKNSKWFKKYKTYRIETEDYGHSVVQFHPIVNGNFSDIELIRRVNIRPELHLYVNSYVEFTGIDYTQEPYNNWIIEMGDRKDLGLLMKASPWVIWKINNVVFHALYNEKYGSPFTHGQTDITDAKLADNMMHMLQSFGNSSYLMSNLDDKLEFVSPSNGDGKTYEVFANFCDQQISKLFLGNTGETDMAGGGTFAQAKVHAEVSEETAKAYLSMIETDINSQLIPFLISHGMNWEGYSYTHVFNESISIMDKFSIYERIKIAGYDIDTEQFEKEFGVKITKPEAPIESTKPNNSVLNFMKPQQK